MKITIATLAFLLAAIPVLARQTASGPPEPAAKERTGAAKVRADAVKLAPLFPQGLAKRFIEAAMLEQVVPAIGTRELLLNKSTREWFTIEEGMKLTPTEQSALTPTPCNESLYYETKYGSPLVYARVLEVAEKHGASFDTENDPPPAFLDFGYGTIGHLRVTGALGIESAGADVDSLLRGLYAEERATGRIQRLGKDSTVPLHLFHGHWPAEPALAEAVRAAKPGGYDLITSKNTLKNGYLHPEKPADEKKLIKLGVTDEAFVEAAFNSLKPGGLFVIYNISPRPSREGEPYKPWADGRCPFPKEMLEHSQFEVLAFDEVDDAKAEAVFTALGYPIVDSKGEKDLFARYTVVRRPAR